MPARKTAADTTAPDEAQAAPIVDADVVEETPEEKPPSNLEYLQKTVAAMKTSLRAELTPKFDAIASELENLTALVTAGAPEGEPTVDDRIAELAVQVQLLTENRVTPVSFQELKTSVQELRASVVNLEDWAREGATVGEDVGAPLVLAAAPAAAPTGKHILKAIHQVMKAVTFVPKSGQYSGGGARYSFRKFDDTAAALGAEFRTYGIFVQTRVIDRQRENYSATSGNGKEQRWTETVVEVEYVFTSLVDGSDLKVQSYGEGKDSSDKSTAKAMTMAMKTALTQAFMIPTDEPDPDQSRPGDTDYGPPVGGAHEQGPPPEDDLADQHTPQELAMGAWRAATAPGMTRQKLNGIWAEATDRRLMNVEIQPHPQEKPGPLGQFLTVVGQTLPPA